MENDTSPPAANTFVLAESKGGEGEEKTDPKKYHKPQRISPRKNTPAIKIYMKSVALNLIHVNEKRETDGR